MSFKDKLQNNLFYVINLLTGRVAAVERQLMRMQEDMDKKFALQRNHMVRLKNREELSDDFLLNGRSYNDLAPEKAWSLFQKKDLDFLFIDVSHKDFQPEGHRPKETIHIPLEQLEMRWKEIPNKSTPVFLISEEGLRSVLACDFLASKGYYNC
ncbi:MAG: rhodanese-like domain-containing protein, partial [Bacteriovoracaceae bacterium]|nr:rhodanese-like domain-containing protein [Bacteriovoracaceae bacterium]